MCTCKSPSPVRDFLVLEKAAIRAYHCNQEDKGTFQTVLASSERLINNLYHLATLFANYHLCKRKMINNNVYYMLFCLTHRLEVNWFCSSLHLINQFSEINFGTRYDNILSNQKEDWTHVLFESMVSHKIKQTSLNTSCAVHHHMEPIIYFWLAWTIFVSIFDKLTLVSLPEAMQFFTGRKWDLHQSSYGSTEKEICI